MKPGPLTSTSEQMSSREAAATTSSATWRGGRPTCLARARAPLAWKSARSDARSTGSAPGAHGVEGGLEPLQEDAGGVGHPSFSHARRARRARAGAASVRRRPHGAVHQAVAPVRAEEAVLEQAVADVRRRRRTRPRGRRCRTGRGPAPRRRRGRGPGSPARARGTSRGASRRRCRSRSRWRRSWPAAACR